MSEKSPYSKDGPRPGRQGLKRKPAKPLPLPAYKAIARVGRDKRGRRRYYRI